MSDGPPTLRKNGQHQQRRPGQRAGNDRQGNRDIHRADQADLEPPGGGISQQDRQRADAVCAIEFGLIDVLSQQHRHHPETGRNAGDQGRE